MFSLRTSSVALCTEIAQGPESKIGLMRGRAGDGLPLSKLHHAAFDANLIGNRLADIWLENHARVKLKPTAVVEYERMIYADLRPRLGEMAAALITKQDVILKVRDKIAGRGARVHANHVVGMVSRIYSWAIDEKYVENNPAYKIRKAAAGRARFSGLTQMLMSSRLMAAL